MMLFINIFVVGNTDDVVDTIVVLISITNDSNEKKAVLIISEKGHLVRSSRA